ncbi:MAG: hypothetical protein ABIF85_01950 [Nanoarchaeota archaeon]
MESVTVKLSSGIFTKLSLENMLKDGSSLIEFLSFLDISDVEECVFQKYYKRTPQYSVGGMLRLAAAYYFHKDKGYVKTIKSLTETDIKILKFKKSPSPQELQDFIHNRMGENGFIEIMKLIAPKLNKLAEQKGTDYLSHDSTPNEAGRYDKYADFNKHYKCNMYKSHITMKGTIPLLLTFSRGNANDSPYLKPHADMLNEFKITGKFMNLDGQYDSYKNYALVKHIIGAYPYMTMRENAIINKTGKIDEINRWCNKLWKFGGNPNNPIGTKLDFLFKHDRIKQAGAYYRNNNLENGMPKEEIDLRKRQEWTHDHIKTTVKFDVRNRQNLKKSLHIIAAFISYQLLVLTALQNELNPNEFGFIKR